MHSSREALLFAAFSDAADAAVLARPGVDRELARELVLEAATMLHNGLVLDDLDDHDYAVTVTHLSLDLTSVDPTAAVHARARTTAEDTATFHDPATVAATHRSVAALLRL